MLMVAALIGMSWLTGLAAGALSVTLREGRAPKAGQGPR